MSAAPEPQAQSQLPAAQPTGQPQPPADAAEAAALAAAATARGTSVADPYEEDDSSAQAFGIDLTTAGYGAAYSDARSIFPVADEDWMSFSGVEGTLVLLWTDTTFFDNETDTQITVYDDALTPLATDDNGGTDANDFADIDAYLPFSLPADGTYYVKVTGTAGTNDFYTFTAYAFPDAFELDNGPGTARPISITAAVQSENRALTSGDSDWYAVEINTSDELHLQLTGTHNFIPGGQIELTVLNSALVPVATDDDGSGFSLDFESNAADTYFLVIQGAPGEYSFSWNWISGGADLYEDDDNDTQARLVTFTTTGASEAHSFAPDDTDEDWIKFSGTLGQTYTLWATGANSNATVYDAAMLPLATSTSFEASPDFRLDFVAPATGDYFVKIMGDTGISGAYTLFLVQGFGTPQNVAATDGTLASKIRISWDAVPGANEYYVYRSTTQNGTYSQLGAPTTSLFMDNVQATRATFWYKVKGFNTATGGYTLASTEDSGFSGLIGPTGIVATDGTFTDRVRINWNAVTGATSYKVWRATAQAGTYALLGSTASLQFDNFPTNNNQYWYKVQAVDAAGDGLFGTPNAGYRALAAPANVVASNAAFNDRVRVTWNSVVGATSYKVYYASSVNGTYVQIGSPVTSPLQLDHMLSTTATYFYKVKASNTAGDSAFSTADAGYRRITAPVTVIASDGPHTDKIRLSWSSVSGATSYKITRATTQAGTYTQVGAPTAALFYDDAVPTLDLYWYKIIATNANGDSLPSVENSGFKLPAAPTGVVASDGTFSDKVAISWTAVPGATGYTVWHAATQTGTYTTVGSPAGTSFDHAIATGAVGWYKVKATGPNGASAFSVADSGYKAVLPTPSNVAATDGTFTDRIRITWTAVPGATTYKVYSSSSASGPFTQVGSPTSQLVFDNYVAVTTPVFYKVSAHNSSGSSAQSAADSGIKGS